MSHPVVIEVTRSCESFATNTTLMWFLAAMNAPEQQYKQFEIDIIHTSRYYTIYNYLWVFKLLEVENPLLQTSQI